MATPFVEVYDLFLRRVDSYDLSVFTEEELLDEIKGYLDLAIANFTVCKKDLSKVTDSNFDETLTTTEKHILASFMVIELIKPRITTDELMIQSLTDKDIRMTSQANHLKLMIQLRSDLEKRVLNDMNNYIVKQGLDGLKG